MNLIFELFEGSFIIVLQIILGILIPLMIRNIMKNNKNWIKNSVFIISCAVLIVIQYGIMIYSHFEVPIGNVLLILINYKVLLKSIVLIFTENIFGTLWYINLFLFPVISYILSKKDHENRKKIIKRIAYIVSLLILISALIYGIVNLILYTKIVNQFPIVFSALNKGFLSTLKLFCITLVGALPLGLIISFGSMSKFKPLSGFVKTIVWIVRGTPLMIQLLIIFYLPGMISQPSIWGQDVSGRLTAASVAFVINYACYFSEIYRGGIQGVPKGQQEAGQVLGMTKSQIFFRVTLLQMIKRIVPPMSNEIITLVKDTSLARIIAFQELIFAGDSFRTGTQGISGQIWPLFFTCVYYLAFSGILTLLFSWIEKKLSYFRS